MYIKRHKDEQLLELLRVMASDTPLRESLENILRARTGALIVIGKRKD